MLHHKVVRLSFFVHAVILVSGALIPSREAMAQVAKADGARPLNFQAEGISAQCNVNAQIVTCTVTVTGSELNDAFTLTNPSRLVADFKFTNISAAKKLVSKPVAISKGSHLLKQMRFGFSTTPGSGNILRVVFDTEKLAEVTVTKETNSAKFSYSIAKNEPLIEQKKSEPSYAEIVRPSAVPTLVAMPTLIASPTVEIILTVNQVVMPTNIPAVIPSIIPSLTPTVIHSATPTISPIPALVVATTVPTRQPTALSTATIAVKISATVAPKITATPTAVAATPIPVIAVTATDGLTGKSETEKSDSGKIEKIVFDKSSQPGELGSSVVRILLGGRADARVSKLDERTYEVMVSDFTLAGRYLSLPYFPPEDFAGITHVKLVQKPEAVQIIIGINRGVRIVPTTKTGELTLRVIE